MPKQSQSLRWESCKSFAMLLNPIADRQNGLYSGSELPRWWGEWSGEVTCLLCNAGIYAATLTDPF